MFFSPSLSRPRSRGRSRFSSPSLALRPLRSLFWKVPSLEMVRFCFKTVQSVRISMTDCVAWDLFKFITLTPSLITQSFPLFCD